MTKSELITQVAESVGETKKCVTAVLASLTKTIQTTDKVTLVGFGTFSLKTRAARNGRKPQTGATMQIAAKKVLSFKGSALPDAA